MRIRVKPAPVTSIDLPSKNQVVVGGAIRPTATARTSSGNPRADVAISWSSDNPSIASVDSAGLVIGLKPGKANIKAVCERANATMAVEVTANPVKSLGVEPRSANARTGDVIRFSTSATDGAGKAIDSCEVRWAVRRRRRDDRAGRRVRRRKTWRSMLSAHRSAIGKRSLQ